MSEIAEIIAALDGIEEALDNQIYPVRQTEHFDAPDDAEYHVVLTAKQYRGFERAMLKIHELARK